MAERRPLSEGIKPVPREVEKSFVFQDKPNAAPVAPPGPRVVAERLPLSTRIRADIANALKRASLERQLGNVEPSSLQEIIEDALEPWLRTHGYLK
jgi:hypothetical protein